MQFFLSIEHFSLPSVSWNFIYEDLGFCCCSFAKAKFFFISRIFCRSLKFWNNIGTRIKRKYFKARNFRGMRYLQHFNFAVFLNNFWILRHCNFLVWPPYYHLWHFSFPVVLKIGFFLRAWVSNISRISGKAWTLITSLNTA